MGAKRRVAAVNQGNDVSLWIIFIGNGMMLFHIDLC